MAFVPYSSDSRNEEPALTVDKQGRLCLNAALRRKLGCRDKEIEMFVFFEEETRRIGISTTYPQGEKARIKPFKFDKSRGTCYAYNFLEFCDIPYQEGAVRFAYDETVSGVMAFKASREYKRDGLTFRQENNALALVK